MQQTLTLLLVFASVYLVDLVGCQSSIREHVRRDSNPNPLVAKNLFIESDALARCHDINTRSQFYRTNSSLRRLYDCVPNRKESERAVVLVTGGAGFVGSHLVDSLMLDGHHVLVCDNFSTGKRLNIEHWLGHKNFKLLEQDVTSELRIQEPRLDRIYHLAAPASPLHYMIDPIRTIETIVFGTMNILKLARKTSARVLLASTSEIYGDPLVHPQPETYWGNTNPIGPRAPYDESKRMGETLAVANRDQYNVSIAIARIFNTYGPRMGQYDGRVMSNFVTQALQNKPITIYGTGNQTRSFQYISDLVRGLRTLMDSQESSPVNLGNPDEVTIWELSQEVLRAVPRSNSEPVHVEPRVDDPKRRRPDISKAKNLLNWQPEVPLKTGLERTVDYFRQDLKS